MKRWWFLKITKFAAIFVVMVLLLGFVVMQLWNALIPDLLKGPEITFLQAVGILVLTHILFHGGPRRHWHSGHRERWRKHWEEKLASLTPEEREKLKAEWKRRCGWTEEETEKKTNA